MTVKDVLIIEDDEGFQFYLSKMVEFSFPDVQVLQAYDGKQALNFINERHVPALILLDINMPSMNGHEFLEVIQSEFEKVEATVIVVSSSEAEVDKKIFQKYGFVKDYLLKPVFEDDLRKYLEN